MANKKNLLGILAITLVLGFLGVGCATPQPSQPLFYSDNAHKEFTILGEVIFNASGQHGYVDFLNEARKQYPDTDYLIDIMVDLKVTDGKNSSYIYRGTAIKYKK